MLFRIFASLGFTDSSERIVGFVLRLLTVPKGPAFICGPKDRTCFLALSDPCSAKRSFSVSSLTCFFNSLFFSERDAKSDLSVLEDSQEDDPT